ncbi:hypothetical protein C8J57DRAFT_1228587 [Mycena rebaudengoi]|nr:hypothetical protein C8J57DRAFT_1228587 [Mycena rebaudengoi]
MASHPSSPPYTLSIIAGRGPSIHASHRHPRPSWALNRAQRGQVDPASRAQRWRVAYGPAAAADPAPIGGQSSTPLATRRRPPRALGISKVGEHDASPAPWICARIQRSGAQCAQDAGAVNMRSPGHRRRRAGAERAASDSTRGGGETRVECTATCGPSDTTTRCTPTGLIEIQGVQEGYAPHLRSSSFGDGDGGAAVDGAVWEYCDERACKHLRAENLNTRLVIRGGGYFEVSCRMWILIRHEGKEGTRRDGEQRRRRKDEVAEYLVAIGADGCDMKGKCGAGSTYPAAPHVPSGALNHAHHKWGRSGVASAAVARCTRAAVACFMRGRCIARSTNTPQPQPIPQRRPLAPGRGGQRARDDKSVAEELGPAPGHSEAVQPAIVRDRAPGPQCTRRTRCTLTDRGRCRGGSTHPVVTLTHHAFLVGARRGTVKVVGDDKSVAEKLRPRAHSEDVHSATVRSDSTREDSGAQCARGAAAYGGQATLPRGGDAGRSEGVQAARVGSDAAGAVCPRCGQATRPATVTASAFAAREWSEAHGDLWTRRHRGAPHPTVTPQPRLSKFKAGGTARRGRRRSPAEIQGRHCAVTEDVLGGVVCEYYYQHARIAGGLFKRRVARACLDSAVGAKGRGGAGSGLCMPKVCGIRMGALRVLKPQRQGRTSNGQPEVLKKKETIYTLMNTGRDSYGVARLLITFWPPNQESNRGKEAGRRTLRRSNFCGANSGLPNRNMAGRRRVRIGSVKDSVIVTSGPGSSCIYPGAGLYEEGRKAHESPPPKRCQNALVTLLLPGTLIKRARATPPPGYSTQIAIFLDGDKSKGLVRSVQRTSGLDARIVSLAGAHGIHLSLFPN